MIQLLLSLRSLILGETWTIPLGVAAALVVAALFRLVLPEHLWNEVGGFVLAGMVAATLITSISHSSRH